MINYLLQWFDSYAGAPGKDEDTDSHVEWTRVLPFVLLHIACLFVFVVGVSPFAFALFFVSYAVRCFGITGGYHRYFAHRSYKVGRITQFLLAFIGAAATQRGPLWWAAHHRHHHKHSDEVADPHSPVAHPFWWSHMGWFMARGNFRTRTELITDFAKFPELVLIDRFDILVPIAYGTLMFGIGVAANALWPELGTNGWQCLVWGFVLSTIFLHHVTFTINSLTHVDGIGKRPYSTDDHSHNVWWLSALTFGESWHNNHHHFPGSARLGFRWWQLDIGYLTLRALSLVGIVREMRGVPERYLKAE